MEILNKFGKDMRRMKILLRNPAKLKYGTNLYLKTWNGDKTRKLRNFWNCEICELLNFQYFETFKTSKFYNSETLKILNFGSFKIWKYLIPTIYIIEQFIN